MVSLEFLDCQHGRTWQNVHRRVAATKQKNWTKKLFQLPSLKLTEAPENGPSQKETSIPTIHVQVLR